MSVPAYILDALARQHELTDPVAPLRRRPTRAPRKGPARPQSPRPATSGPGDEAFSADAETLTHLPAGVDLRRNCPPVYDQGRMGSAVAQALAAALEFSRMKQGAAVFTPSRLFLYYNARAIGGTTKTDSGATITHTIEAAQQFGAPPEALWPYVEAHLLTKPPAHVYSEATRYRGIAYRSVPAQAELLKACLAGGYPVLFGFQVYESFVSGAVSKTGRAELPRPGEQLIGGHACLLVGYDESQSRFWALNSWGAQWGAAGYFTLPYDYLVGARGRNLASDFYTIRSVW
jgi:C1A family cysteine protease